MMTIFFLDMKDLSSHPDDLRKFTLLNRLLSLLNL